MKFRVTLFVILVFTTSFFAQRKPPLEKLEEPENILTSSSPSPSPSPSPPPSPTPIPFPTPTLADILGALEDGPNPLSILDEDQVYYIRNKSTSRCMAIDRSDRYNRANAVTVHCSSPDENYCDIRSRQWKFKLPGGAIGEGYMLYPQISSLCGDMYAGSSLIGTRFQQFACDPSKSNQRFYVHSIKKADNQDWFAITPKNNIGCLQATGGPTDPVELTNCNLNDDTILWTLIPIENEPLWKSCPSKTPPQTPPDQGSIFVQSVSVSPASVTLGGSVTLTVTLNRATPGGMIVVPSSESDGAEATIVDPQPINVIIPAGSKTGSSTFRTQRVKGYATRIIFYIKVGLETRAAQLNLSP